MLFDFLSITMGARYNLESNASSFVCEVVKLSKIYRKGCENLKLFLIGMWGSDAASVL